MQEQGVLYVTEDKTIPLIEASVKVQEIAVIESFSLIIARMDKGEKCECLIWHDMYIFRMDESHLIDSSFQQRKLQILSYTVQRQWRLVKVFNQ